MKKLQLGTIGLAITFVCLIFMVLPLQVIPTSSGAASASCPSNQILKMGLFGGAPNSFNMLSALPPSGTVSSNIQYLYLYPNPTITGQLDYNDSIINSFSHNSNYSQWTFNVNPNLKWSNGQNVNASDILRTYSNSFALNASVDFVGAGAEIVNMKAINNTAVTFYLNVSDAHFGERIGSNLFTTIMPSSFIANGPSFDGFGSTNVVTGPFYADNYATGTPQAVFLRNEYYNPTPGACELQINYYESDSSIPEYISSGSLDFGIVPANSVASLLQNPSVSVVAEPSLMMNLISYNVSTFPYNMTAFRQALAYGINQTQIQQQAWAGYSQTAYSSEGGVPTTTSAWYSASQTSYSYNPTKALSLLSTVGITKGTDGYLQYANHTDITLSMWYNDAYAGNIQASGIVQSNLELLGFKVNTFAATEGTLIGDSFSNAHGINSAMILDNTVGPLFGYAWTDAEPTYAVDIPYNAPPSWEGPAGSVAQAQYESNLSAIVATSNPTLDYQYLANIQALNSQNLPSIIVGYPDLIWAYNNQRFTNWPSSFSITANVVNDTALAQITPLAQSSTSTPTISTSSSSSTPTSSLTSTTSTSSSTSSKTITSDSILVVVAIVVMSGIGVLFTRRGRKSS